MSKRKIINIDEAKCNGCGLCMPNCPEGAIQIIDGKARLVSDLFCDGLGACIGHCPQGAIAIEERAAEEYDEARVMENIVKQGKNVLAAHLTHLKDHKLDKYLEQALSFLKNKGVDNPLGGHKTTAGHVFSGCPGSKMMDLRFKVDKDARKTEGKRADSELNQWPVQLMLVPEHAPYFDHADLLIAADCVPFAYADFHRDLLKGKILLVGCPKLDDTQVYREKINNIIKSHEIKSITYAHMQVPCCFGLVNVIKESIDGTCKKIPFKEVIIGIKGEIIN